jgi:hypothetical protein
VRHSRGGEHVAAGTHQHFFMDAFGSMLACFPKYRPCCAHTVVIVAIQDC